MIATRASLALAFVGGLSLSGLSFPAAAEDDPAALAKALSAASVSLEQGLKASAADGKPISGKYEIEDGALQLSVYTQKGNGFSEVIVDHKSGAIKKAEPITEGDDLKHAKEQSQTMAKAKQSLDAAVAGAVKANAGYRAVAVTPMVSGGQPIASIVLMKGESVKKVTWKLD